ncbi:MAG: glycosyltransferase 2 family protein [Treponematales bacterium]
MGMLAPVVLFVYNRPEHTRKTVEALSKNALAAESELFVFSDAPKDENASDKVAAVRDYIKTISGFKKITVTEQATNKGLAASIIDGVTETVNRYGKIIVLEDDIVTGKYFLTYMNEALEKYENEKRVMHIAACHTNVRSGDIERTPREQTASFFSPVMDCWGWATWADRWRFFMRDPAGLVAAFDSAAIRRFNADGTCPDKWGQVLANAQGHITTWAVFGTRRFSCGTASVSRRSVHLYATSVLTDRAFTAAKKIELFGNFSFRTTSIADGKMRSVLRDLFGNQPGCRTSPILHAALFRRLTLTTALPSFRRGWK